MATHIDDNQFQFITTEDKLHPLRIVSKIVDDPNSVIIILVVDDQKYNQALITNYASAINCIWLTNMSRAYSYMKKYRITIEGLGNILDFKAPYYLVYSNGKWIKINTFNIKEYMSHVESSFISKNDRQPKVKNLL